jgi:hypothetical protein
MTMPRAIALLLISGAITAFGVFLVFTRVNDGLVNSTNPSRGTGAFIGENAATPPGVGSTSRGAADATVAAARAEITAAAATRNAVLTPFPTGTGGRGEAVAIGETITVGTSSFTVHSIADPEPPGFFPTQAGFRRIAVEVTQQAVSGTVRYQFSEFRLRDSTGEVRTWTTANSNPGFASGTLQAGQERRGWLSFQVPDGVGLDALIWQPLGSASAVVLVDLR